MLIKQQVRTNKYSYISCICVTCFIRDLLDRCTRNVNNSSDNINQRGIILFDL